jgi:hypothetical protein
MFVQPFDDAAKRWAVPRMTSAAIVFGFDV